MNTSWTRGLVAVVAVLASSTFAQAGSDETFGPISFTAGYGAAVTSYSVPVATTAVVEESVPVVSGPTTTYYAPSPTVTYSPVVTESAATVAYSAPVTYVAPAPVVVSRPVVTYRPAPVTAYYAAPVTTYYAPAPVTTYYAPPVTTYYAPAPVTTYYAPAAAYYAPVTSYYAPVLPPRYYYPGQPVRNAFRRWGW